MSYEREERGWLSPSAYRKIDRLERRDDPPDLLPDAEEWDQDEDDDEEEGYAEEEDYEPDIGDIKYHAWADEHPAWEDE